MKLTTKITVRSFPVAIRDQRTGEQRSETIVIDKARFQAAQLVGMSSENLIHSYYGKAGYRVISIGVPEKKDIEIDLQSLWEGSNG